MTADLDIKIAYLGLDNSSKTKSLNIPNRSANDDALVAFANAWTVFLKNPVTEAAKIVTTPLSLS